MLFEGNAKIAGRYFKKPLGVLKEGAAADIIVTDYTPLTPVNGDNVNDDLDFGRIQERNCFWASSSLFCGYQS